MLLFCATVAGVAGGEPVVVESEHYRLTSAGTRAEAEDWSRMLETAYPKYAEFFGKVPALAKGERLAVSFSETSAEMEAAIKKGGGASPGGEGGYYDPVSKCAYLFRQPSVWYTRALLLHECAHQFHWRARALTSSPPFWYGEGIAEHLAHHTWDGEHLRLGVVPALTLEKYAGKALEAAKAPAFDLGRVVDAATGDDRPVAMHLVRFLCAGENGKLRAKFDDAGQRMERGAKFDAAAFARTFGPAKKFAADFRAWLETVQEPWEVLTVDWDARAADALRGASPNVVSLCRRRAETTKVAATLRFVGDGGRNGGLLLRWASGDEYDLLMIRGGRVRIERRKDGRWTTTSDVEAPPSDEGAWRVEAVRDGGVVKCTVNGAAVAELEVPAGSMGLCLDASTVDFTEIRAE